MAQEVHRPTIKQQNKTHKTGPHKTKGQVRKQAQGRVSVKALSKKNKKQLDKQARRCQASQLRKQKREDVMNKKRNKGGASGTPILIAVIGLSEAADTASVLDALESCDEDATVVTNELQVTHINVPRFRQRLSFVVPRLGDMYSALDAVKVADTALLVLDCNTGLDDYGDYCLSCLMAQGMPTPVLTVQGLKELPLKKQSEGKKLLLKTVSKLFPDEKLHPLDTPQEGLQLLRVLGNHKLRDIGYRDRRPHLLAEDLTFELPGQQSASGTLKVSGYVRGQTLSVNGLVHLPGWGDFQMLQLDAPSDPYSLATSRSRHNSNTGMEADSDGIKVLEKSDPAKQSSLQREAEIDPMEGEQTWPTDEELMQAEVEAAERKTQKRVPKGTSEYQAAWITDDADDVTSQADSDDDSSENEDEGMEEEEDSDAEAEIQSQSQKESDGEEEYETISVKWGDEVRYDNTMDLDEEASMLAKYREARQHQQFPDEVDTPQDVPARVRFQKYRGLKSFRTSPWDPKENLPLEYAKIFQFENFNRTKKRVLKTQDEAQGALPGWYVTIHIADVPKEFMESYVPGTPVTVFGLLDHEQKLSVSNYMLTRTQTYGRPVKAKETMVFHVGYRRFTASPVYSQHTNGDKHKFERFLRHGILTVATVYAPITFPAAPVLMFKQTTSGRHELVATGNILSINPDRIIAKRIVLSGHPFRITKTMATVRYMFFNREDIQWFKPVELRTKWGRRGHIKDMLGTHGHMKCVFDGQLKSQDTILMTLYKRVFPKWTYDPRVRAPDSTTEAPVREEQHHLDDLASEMFDD